MASLRLAVAYARRLATFGWARRPVVATVARRAASVASWQRRSLRVASWEAQG